MRNLKIVAVTTSLIMSVVIAASAAVPAPAKHVKKHPAAASASGALVAKGKAISMRCTGCHNTDLGGRPGRTPNIKSSGELKNYNTATFARLMDKGLDEKGKAVHMPVQHLVAADSKALYTYLKTLK